MPFASGSRVTAAALNNNTVRTLEARSSGDETVTTTVTDVNGASLNITTPVANTVVTVKGYFDVATTGGTDVFIGTLYVNGVVQNTGEVHHEGAGSDRDSGAQEWTVTLASAGSHTLNLRRQKINNSDAVTLFGIHTKITVSGLGIS